MRAIVRAGLLAAIIMLVCGALLGCGGGDDQSGPGEPTTKQSQSAGTDSGQDAAPADTQASDSSSGADGAQAETEVSGMPAEFPADVPVHPGTVTAYEKTEVTESTTVHQLTVESVASFDDVIAWYETQLPAGWSVGFFETEGGEAKIALNGGSYAPANPDGRGGGVLIGVFEGDKTRIVTTVTVMGS
jgi:hypothetical protein